MSAFTFASGAGWSNPNNALVFDSNFAACTNANYGTWIFLDRVAAIPSVSIELIGNLVTGLYWLDAYYSGGWHVIVASTGFSGNFALSVPLVQDIKSIRFKVFDFSSAIVNLDVGFTIDPVVAIAPQAMHHRKLQGAR